MGIDKVSISLIRTGEATGKLSEVLAELVASLKWSDEIAAQTKKLLLYPVFSALVVFGAVGFLMIYLVPQLLNFIKNIGGVVPIQTVALVALSDFLVNFWYVMPIAAVLVFVTVMAAVRLSPQVRLSIDGAKLRIPLLGPVLKKIIMARFSRSFGLMYKSGISVIAALAFCETLSTNAAFRKAINGAAQNISQGQKISDAFAETKLFPALVVRMLRVGETTGGLDKALENVSYFYTREVNESIEKLQELIQPILTLVLGGTVIWIMSSVLLPIYDMISKIKL
jgi:type IV pilus assembly protein PilC